MDNINQYKKNILNGKVPSIELLELNKCYNVLNWLYVNGFELGDEKENVHHIWHEIKQINAFKNTPYLTKLVDDCVKLYKFNKLKLVLSYVTNQKIDWNKVLMCVARFDDAEVIRSVLMRSPTNIDEALRICVNKKNILELFVEFGASRSVLEDKFYDNPKMENISLINVDWDRLLLSSKSVDILDLCLGKPIEFYKNDISNATSIVMNNAIRCDRYEVVEYLLSNNFILTKEMIDASRAHGVYPIGESVCLLIHDYIGVDITAIITNACKNGDIKETERLITEYNYYKTGEFIKIAVDNNDVEMFSMLINNHFEDTGLIYMILNRPNFLQYITNPAIDVEYELIENISEEALSIYYNHLKN